MFYEKQRLLSHNYINFSGNVITHIQLFFIFTSGSTPYPGMGAREVMRRVRDGYRLERPSHCHPQLYSIITKCWAGDMNKRPDFTELRQVHTTPVYYLKL